MIVLVKVEDERMELRWVSETVEDGTKKEEAVKEGSEA